MDDQPGGPAPLAVTTRPGHGGRVVLVHGAMDRSRSFAKVVRRLDGCEVVTYDRRGYGDSTDHGVCRTVAAHVDDLLTVLGADAAVVVGHSLGGTIALAAAERRPDLVRAVVAYEAPRPWVAWWPTDSAGSRATGVDDPAEAAERFMRRMVGDERWERLPRRTRDERRAEGEALVADLRSIRGEPAYHDDAVTVPVVAAHGSASGGHHVRTAEELAASVPHGELVVVEGAAHGVHLTHPDALADLARRALDRSRAP
ncbi:MAG TPA: alpha/beta hydrolase [Acidimicrobiales bacterium]|nr:alpha/beta hydrolase [Acidimicrobiales bacterium]